jgi:hypothetical protein
VLAARSGVFIIRRIAWNCSKWGDIECVLYL